MSPELLGNSKRHGSFPRSRSNRPQNSLLNIVLLIRPRSIYRPGATTRETHESPPLLEKRV